MYGGNNPFIGTDPDGEFFLTLAAALTGQWHLLPAAIGADLGMWQGGRMANGGEVNPYKWNWNSGKTWGHVVAGGVVGGVSGYVGNSFATSKTAFAYTKAMMASSFTNSFGTSLYTDGKTDVSFSFGFGSVNLSKGKVNGIWNWGNNSGLENIGYTLGTLGNLSDIANIVDNYTQWENKLAAEAKAYMDEWTAKNPDAVVDPNTVGKNFGRTFPSYLAKNPETLGSKLNYMGMVKNWSWREYAGYLHDAEYIAKFGEEVKGAKYLLFSYKSYGADIRLMARTVFLGLKHRSPFELIVGSGLGVTNFFKLSYGWIYGY